MKAGRTRFDPVHVQGLRSGSSSQSDESEVWILSNRRQEGISWNFILNFQLERKNNDQPDATTVDWKKREVRERINSWRGRGQAEFHNEQSKQ